MERTGYHPELYQDSNEESQHTYESHRSLIDPEMRRRLGQLVKDAQHYKTKACGMHSLLGLTGPSNTDIELQRIQRRRMVRKPPIPTMRRASNPLTTSTSSYIAPVQQKISMRNYNNFDYTQKENV
jgi:hypothetical protein